MGKTQGGDRFAVAPDAIEAFVLAELDRAGIGHHTFTADALAGSECSEEGQLRRAKDLCLGTLIEAVCDQTRIVDLEQVNRVLSQNIFGCRSYFASPPPKTGFSNVGLPPR